MIGFPKTRETRLESKQRKGAALESARREAYRIVELRDGYRCRACARGVVRTAELRANRLEHHHVMGRGSILYEATANICVLCKACHDERHVTRRLSIHGNADGTLRFEKDDHVWRG